MIPTRPSTSTALTFISGTSFSLAFASLVTGVGLAAWPLVANRIAHLTRYFPFALSRPTQIRAIAVCSVLTTACMAAGSLSYALNSTRQSLEG